MVELGPCCSHLLRNKFRRQHRFPCPCSLSRNSKRSNQIRHNRLSSKFPMVELVAFRSHLLRNKFHHPSYQDPLGNSPRQHNQVNSSYPMALLAEFHGHLRRNTNLFRAAVHSSSTLIQLLQCFPSDRNNPIRSNQFHSIHFHCNSHEGNLVADLIH